jgi:hypothetical protein
MPCGSGLVRFQDWVVIGPFFALPAIITLFDDDPTMPRLFLCLLTVASSQAFIASGRSQSRHTRWSPKRGEDPCVIETAPTSRSRCFPTTTFGSHFSSPTTKLHAAFDMSKPFFDLYAVRTVRGDALAKYNTLNQSEPLRINLWLFLAASFLTSTWTIPAITDIAIIISPLQTIALVALGLGSLYLANIERDKRNNQLLRIERELAAQDLFIRLPPGNALADARYRVPQTIRSVLSNGNRVVAIYCADNAALAADDLVELRALSKRFQQANTYVVISTKEPLSVMDPVIAIPADPAAFRAFFTESLGLGTTSSTGWFGLKSNGRSFGSGSSLPSWLQILGKSLLPVQPLYYDDSSTVSKSASVMDRALQAAQQRFYHALTTGNETTMAEIYGTANITANPLVSQVIAQGGRLDDWAACLKPDARPIGLKIAGADSLIVNDGRRAYTTCIEFPAASMTPSSITDATLLAVQQWERLNDDEEDDDDDVINWRLCLHQTIPWTSERPAAGTLLCDGRGCVSLVQSNAR